MNTTTQQDTQAAVNKAAEEGGLPMTVREAFEDRHEGYEFPSEALKSGAFVEYMAGWRAADRASRQVANKAEVEVNDCAMAIYDISLMLGLPRGATPADVCLAVDRLATPPATTGASTVLTDERTSIDTPEFRERLRGLGATFSAHGDAYKLLVGYVNRHNTIGAVTALTDERIMALYDQAIAKGGSADNMILNTCRAVAREVAAQAGQVAVPVDLLERSAKIVESHAVVDEDDSEDSKEEVVNWILRQRAAQIRSLVAPSPAKESK
jgi:hypothetical protein